MKTLIAVAIAGAFAVPVAAQASADGDRIILAQAGGGAAGGGAAGGAPSAPGGAAEQSGTTGSGSQQGGQSGGGSGPLPSTQQSGAGGTLDMGSLDRNNDGHVSRDEAAANPSLSTRFTELDTNNDGRLSSSELNAMGAAGATSAPAQSDPAKARGGDPGTTR